MLNTVLFFATTQALYCAQGGSNSHNSFSSMTTVSCSSSSSRRRVEDAVAADTVEQSVLGKEPTKKPTSKNPPSPSPPSPAPAPTSGSGGDGGGGGGGGGDGKEYCVMIYDPSNIWYDSGSYLWYLDCSTNVDYTDNNGNYLYCDGEGCTTSYDSNGNEARYCCCENSECNTDVENICNSDEDFKYEEGLGSCVGTSGFSGGAIAVCLAGGVLASAIVGCAIFRRKKQVAYANLDPNTKIMYGATPVFVGGQTGHTNNTTFVTHQQSPPRVTPGGVVAVGNPSMSTPHQQPVSIHRPVVSTVAYPQRGNHIDGYGSGVLLSNGGQGRPVMAPPCPVMPPVCTRADGQIVASRRV